MEVRTRRERLQVAELAPMNADGNRYSGERSSFEIDDHRLLFGLVARSELIVVTHKIVALGHDLQGFRDGLGIQQLAVSRA